MNFKNVYYIKIGNKEQPGVEKAAIEENKVLIAYDKQVDIDDLVKLVNDSRALKLDPENTIIVDMWKGLNVTNSNAKANVQTALRRFFLARPGLDCFCTFFGNHLYYGIPADYDQIKKDCERGDLAANCKFRERDIVEWIPDPRLNPKINDELAPNTKYDSRFKFHHLSGMLQKMRAMRATLSRLDDEDSDGGGKFSQKSIFEYTLNDTLYENLVKPLSDAVDGCKIINSDTVNRLKESLLPLIRNLGPSEFESFVDIVFYGRGYRRCSELGGIQEAVDMEYLKLDDKSIVYCQVKSEISPGVLATVLRDIWATGMIPNGNICYIAHHVSEIAEVGKKSSSDELVDTIKSFNKVNGSSFKAMPLSSMMEYAYKMEEVYIFLVGVYLGREKAIDWYNNHNLDFLAGLD